MNKRGELVGVLKTVMREIVEMQDRCESIVRLMCSGRVDYKTVVKG